MTDDTAITIISAQYAASAVRADQYPNPEEDLCEIAFIGRSNVGKSSLLNSLARRHGLARTSGTPGKTQTLNFYRLAAKIDEERQDFFLVDLPGYGYARTGQKNRRQWAKFSEEYMLNSPRLKLICQLIDIRHLPMASDIAAYRWFTENNLPIQLIATKADKISRMGLKRQLETIKRGLGASCNIIAYSAEKGLGRDDLLDVIGRLLLK
ncbi:putative GTP-binding protein EngB [bioreactor metagenome]|uniref:Putative GTP-binding protein EngB n=1 Tax=bioreactor metagenome TaxID=1076179 RepID=A0A644T9F6_9ZZZZ|nr:ribosome biogenesis GTP-binding protein YihA/YsxC [Negativicutes bacterium]